MGRFVDAFLTLKILAYEAQAKLSPEELLNIGQTLGVDASELLAQIGPHWTPHRTLGPIPPTDPVIYRLYEVRVVLYILMIMRTINTRVCWFMGNQSR
jgi:cyanate lyase